MEKKINCKLIFTPSNPPKFENDEGIWRRINPEVLKKLCVVVDKNKVAIKTYQICEAHGVWKEIK